MGYWLEFFDTFHACTNACAAQCEKKQKLGCVGLMVFRMCERMSEWVLFPELFTDDEHRNICKEVLTKVWQVNNLANQHCGAPESPMFSQIMDSTYAIAKETFENERSFVGWRV
jgi:hypothetical protein